LMNTVVVAVLLSIIVSWWSLAAALRGLRGGLWAPSRCSALGAGGLPARAASPGRGSTNV